MHGRGDNRSSQRLHSSHLWPTSPAFWNGAETVEMIVFPFWKKKGLVSIAYTNINNTINTSFFPIFFLFFLFFAFFPMAPAPIEEIRFLVLCFFSGWCLIESINHRIEKVGCLCCFGGIG